ncbi:MAG: galactose mutarotase [Muribaculaceae bacterium]|nr:galactose mutarotase [Muribaculaceae bacterium]
MKHFIETCASPKGEITLITLENESGAHVVLSSLGAGINSIVVPDNQGYLADVVLGYAAADDYLYDGPCMGKIPGRYANRIAGGHLEVDGKVHQLAINNGPNALHGGPEGFQNQIWDFEMEENNRVVFTLVSPDGDEHYPGELTARVAYTWTEDNILKIELNAVTDAPTVVNLTNHTYFNLAGEGSVLDHELLMDAVRWLPTDDTLIPTGELAPVAGTPMDFTSFKPLGRDMKRDFPALNYGKGYDNCWVIDPKGRQLLRTAAVLRHRDSGRVVEVVTDQPAVQIYTGNWLEGCPTGKGGAVYHDYDGVAIECQGLPDAPNKPQFPSQLLMPDEEYRRVIFFDFSTE